MQPQGPILTAREPGNVVFCVPGRENEIDDSLASLSCKFLQVELHSPFLLIVLYIRYHLICLLAWHCILWHPCAASHFSQRHCEWSGQVLYTFYRLRTSRARIVTCLVQSVYCLRTEGEEGGRGWSGWMASSTQWTWVWVSSRRWRRTGKPGVPQSTGSQRVRHGWATEQQLGQSCLSGRRSLLFTIPPTPGAHTRWGIGLSGQKIHFTFTINQPNLFFKPLLSLLEGVSNESHHFSICPSLKVCLGLGWDVAGVQGLVPRYWGIYVFLRSALGGGVNPDAYSSC